MTTDLQLSKEEASEFAEFLKTKVTAIDEKIAPLVKEKESLLERIAKLNGHAKPFTTAFEKVKTEASRKVSELLIPQTNIGKIRHVLKEGNNKPMSTRQIIDRLFVLQPGLRLDKDKVAKNISTVLSINQGAGKVFNRTADVDGNYLFTVNPEYMD